MGWIVDLFEGMPLTVELITKLDSIESELTVLQSADVQQKIEIGHLKEQVAKVEREKEQFQRENEDLRKTREFPHTNLLDLEPLTDNNASLLRMLDSRVGESMPVKQLTEFIPGSHEDKAKQIALLQEQGYIKIDPAGTPQRKCYLTEKGGLYLDQYFLR